MSNVATDIIFPPTGSKIFRVIFLYVGQGDATLLVIPDKDEYKLALVDCNKAEKLGGINLSRMLKDLGQDIDVFINTHPHDDHLRGLKEIYDEVNITEVWHSGHTPIRPYNQIYKDFTALIRNSKEVKLLGSREEKEIGAVKYFVLAPAKYVVDEIDDEKPETRAARIHEQCGVLKFCYNTKEVMLTGDTDLSAWQSFITQYHEERLPSKVFSAPHHGSRSFFKNSEEDEPYMDHLNAINPAYVVISAPKSSESPHDHPHKDAVTIYKDHTNKNSGDVFSLGEKKESIIVDIDSNGNLTIKKDQKLVTHYGFNDNPDDESGPTKDAKKSIAVGVLTKLDHKPMGK